MDSAVIQVIDAALAGEGDQGRQRGLTVGGSGDGGQLTGNASGIVCAGLTKARLDTEVVNGDLGNGTSLAVSAEPRDRTSKGDEGGLVDG